MPSRASLASAVLGAGLALGFVQCGGASAADEPLVTLPDRAGVGGGGPGDDGTNDPQGPALPPLEEPGAPPPPPSCDVDKPFGAPVPLEGFEPTALRATPRLSADELTIYYTTASAAAGRELTRAVRPTTSAPFGGETVLAQSSVSNDHDPSVSFDHLTLYFHSSRNGTHDIFFAERPTAAAPFGAPAPLGGVNTVNANEAHAHVRAAGEELWFVSDRLGGAGGYDIYMARRSGSAFGAATLVSELSSPSQEWLPHPSEDGLTILFSSDRPGGQGKYDLWMARRASPQAPFGAPVPIPELSSPNNDQSGWLSADGCRIYFSSGRNSNDLSAQLFFAQRPR